MNARQRDRVPFITASSSWLVMVGLLVAVCSLSTVPLQNSLTTDGTLPQQPGYHALTNALVLVSPAPSPTNTTNHTRTAWLIPAAAMLLTLHPRQSRPTLPARRNDKKAQRWFAKRLLDGG